MRNFGCFDRPVTRVGVCPAVIMIIVPLKLVFHWCCKSRLSSTPGPCILRPPRPLFRVLFWLLRPHTIQTPYPLARSSRYQRRYKGYRYRYTKLEVKNPFLIGDHEVPSNTSAVRNFLDGKSGTGTTSPANPHHHVVFFRIMYITPEYGDRYAFAANHCKSLQYWNIGY